MSDLTPKDEALLARARKGLSPGPLDHARIKRRVLVQIAAGTVAATAALSTSAEAAVTTGAGIFAGLAKVVAIGVLSVAVVAGAVGVGVVSTRQPSNQAAPESRGPAAPTVVPAAPHFTEVPPAVPTVEPENVGTATSSVTGAAPPVVVDRPTGVSANPPPRPPSPPKAQAEPSPVASNPAPAPAPLPAEGPSTLTAEAGLLRRADAALRAGDAAGALALLDQYATTYPGGVLTEEREAERVVVLCALGRADDARAAASAFLRDHPRSTQAARVRASCGSN